MELEEILLHLKLVFQEKVWCYEIKLLERNKPFNNGCYFFIITRGENGKGVITKTQTMHIHIF